jgi:hypothetical protein
METDYGLDEGPTHDALADHIVNALIEAQPNSMSGAEVIRMRLRRLSDGSRRGSHAQNTHSEAKSGHIP